MNDSNSGGFDTQAAPDELATGDTYLSERQIENAQAVRDRCDNGECQNPVPHPMEAAWIELASPVPNANGLVINYNNPDVEKVGNSLAIGIADAMRPGGIEHHSIAAVREGWKSLSGACLEDLPADLDTRLADLAEGWEGEDFDQFLEQIQHTRETMITALDDVQKGITELEETEEAVYSAQGRENGIIYPAASIWKAGSSMVNKSKIHVRPAWLAGGCPRDRGQDTVWEYLGLEVDLYNDFDRYVEARAATIMEISEARGETVTPQQAREFAEAEYEPVFDDIFAHFSERQQAVSDNHNAFIEDHRDLLRTAQSTPELTAEPAQPASVADPDALDFGDPDLKPPPFPDQMPFPEMDDFAPPASQPADLDIPSPDRPWDGPPPAYSPTSPSYGGPSTGGGSPSGAPPYGGGSPWSSSGPDSDELSGGLAGGAPGGGSGAGLTGAPSPSAGGASGGTGLATAPMGAGGARGAGAGGGRGSGRGGRGGGMMGGGGGRGAPGSGDSEDGRDTWLTEDEDVWGITAEADDPYA